MSSTKDSSTKDWEGEEILCPTCSDEKVTVQKNSKGKPFINCKRYGGCMNFNSIEGVTFIRNLIKGTEHKAEEKKEEHDEDEWKDKGKPKEDEEEDVKLPW